MASLVRLIEMLDRAKEGPICTVEDWERKVIPQTVKKYLKDYELAGTFNKETPVNQDMELADRFFEAGLEMAVEIGLLCPDTETIIRVSKEEILKAIAAAPSHLVMGERREWIDMKSRRPESPIPPVFGGPLCIQVSEDLYVPIAEGILKGKQVRVHEGPSIDTIFEKPVYSGTPFETAVGLRENQLRREAQWRAGRVGIPNACIASSTTEFGQLGAYAGATTPSNPALALILHPAEMKVGYASFHKAIAAIGYDGYILIGTNSMIGGYSGGAEGVVLSNIALVLLQFAVMQADCSDCSIYDVRYDSTCSRHGLWALSTACQGLTRNTHLLLHKVINQSAGPCTEEILYTSAAGLLAGGVSGMPFTVGCRSAGGRFKNYITPAEHWFCGAAFEASAEVSLEKANELVLYMLTKYEETLASPPKGKSFVDCFDIKTLTPTPEWGNIYDSVIADLQGRGYPVNPVVAP